MAIRVRACILCRDSVRAAVRRWLRSLLTPGFMPIRLTMVTEAAPNAADVLENSRVVLGLPLEKVVRPGLQPRLRTIP